MLRRTLLLILITLSFILSGCGDDAKSLVRSSLDDKSGVKISEVYNKKKDDEKSKFAKEVTVAYFEQAKADLSRKNYSLYTQHFYDTLTDLSKHIDSNDKNFANLMMLQQLMQTCESKKEERGRLRDQLELSLDNGRLRYSNAGPIRQYTLYIYHKVLSADYRPLYAAVEAKEYGNEYTGSMVMPSPNDYVAVVHVPQDGVFADGAGLYTFFAAQAGNYKFTDAGGFERNVPLLQFVFDEQVETVRRFVRLSKERDELLEITIPQFINKVLAEPGGEFKTGIPKIDNQTVTSSNQNANQSGSTNRTYVDNGYVNGVGVNLRKGPSLEAEVIRGLDHANVQVIAFTTDSSGREWAQVRLLEDGTEGYIAKEYFKHSTSGYRKDTEQAIGQGHIVGTEVIMRNGQAREADPIGVFNNGESVEILKFVDTPNGELWVKVRRKNGDKGFVFGQYLRKD